MKKMYLYVLALCISSNLYCADIDQKWIDEVKTWIQFASTPLGKAGWIQIRAAQIAVTHPRLKKEAKILEEQAKKCSLNSNANEAKLLVDGICKEYAILEKNVDSPNKSS